jgi:hypothetical protein
MPPEGELSPAALRGPKREVREGSEESPRGRKRKPMADTEKSCGDCEGDCSKCSKMRGKKGKKSVFAEGFNNDSADRFDLKCGKGAISQGEKCRKGPATKAQGPSALVQIGQTVKGVARGALETVKWTSGYNIGKHIATNLTQGRNERGNLAEKSAAVAASALLLGPQAGFGAARRVGAFGNTDLQQHAINEKKEKAWRRSVGYRDSVYAKGFAVDHDQLGV